MATIEERAYEYAKIDRGVKVGVDFDFYEDALKKSEAYAYIQGATDQLKIDKWKTRKAFCSATCGDTCPLKANDVEGGGGLVVNCKKLEMFIEAMEE